MLADTLRTDRLRLRLLSPDAVHGQTCTEDQTPADLALGTHDLATTFGLALAFIPT